MLPSYQFKFSKNDKAYQFNGTIKDFFNAFVIQFGKILTFTNGANLFYIYTKSGAYEIHRFKLD